MIMTPFISRITDQLDAIYEEKDRMTDDLKADRDSSKVNQIRFPNRWMKLAILLRMGDSG